MIRISIIGATGYTGGELLKILLNHPRADVRHVTSESSPGVRIDEIHTDLRRRCDLVLEKFNVKKIAADSDVAFFALPHGVGSKAISDFVKLGKKAVDLSADFRIRDVKTYEQWYKVKHADPALLRKAVYGLPELYRDQIRQANIVANPGCYATTTIFALTPLLRHKLVETDSLVVDAKSGVSGAGKKLASMYHYPEVTENFQAYNVASHRHMPEVEQILGWEAKKQVRITFVPHLLPMNRGILAAAYAKLRRKMSTAQVRRYFQQDYGREAFLRLLPEGRWPQTKSVAHSNFCDINVKVDERTNRVIVLAALDNLVKGASGQAVQNMNLLFGLDETEGLL